jgi:hypothetical protein
MVHELTGERPRARTTILTVEESSSPRDFLSDGLDASA